MKKNNKTYLLLAIVLGVWGIIGFKLLKAVNPAPEREAYIASTERFVPQELKERDTFSIVANYRDPFLGTVKTPKKKGARAKKKPVPPQIPEIAISYTGFITEKSSKRQLFFLTIEGQQQMMGINETFQEVKLLRGTKDKIKVRYHGKNRTIALTQ